RSSGDNKTGCAGRPMGSTRCACASRRRATSASVDSAAAATKMETTCPASQLNRSPTTSAIASPSGPSRAPPAAYHRRSTYQLAIAAAAATAVTVVAFGHPSSEASTTSGAYPTSGPNTGPTAHTPTHTASTDYPGKSAAYAT